MTHPSVSCSLIVVFHVRLALSYRNRVGVSRAVTYQMPLRVVPSKLEITSQLQLAADKVAICWKAEASMVRNVLWIRHDFLCCP